jgi:hypothetical protein
MLEEPMPRYKMVVMSSPVAGRDAEYHDWYQNTHLGQVLAIPGMRSAQRFRLDRNLVEGETPPYLAIYDIETDDLDGVMRDIQGKAGSASLLISEAIDLTGVSAAIYEEFGPVVTSK